MTDSIGSKKVGGLSDYFSFNTDPRMREMMEKYNGFGSGQNENDFENLGYRIYHFEDNDD